MATRDGTPCCGLDFVSYATAHDSVDSLRRPGSPWGGTSRNAKVVVAKFSEKVLRKNLKEAGYKMIFSFTGNVGHRLELWAHARMRS